jgi:putative transposase
VHALIAESGLPRQRACAAVGESRATHYRHPRSSEPKHTVRQASHRRLPEAQRAEVREILHSPRFCDQTPAHTYHTLLAEGLFLCSIRTMQRLLKEAGESRERRPIRPPQTHAVPRLEAVAHPSISQRRF